MRWFGERADGFSALKENTDESWVSKRIEGERWETKKNGTRPKWFAVKGDTSRQVTATAIVL